MAKEGDPEDLDELDPPLPDETEPEDLQDEALVEDEADEQSEPDEIDASQQQPEQRQPDQDRQPSRRDRRIEALTTSLAEERRQREELNRRLDAVLTGQSRQPAGETQEQRAQRLALLTPEERIREELNEAKTGFAQQLQRMEISSRDGADRAAFQAKATVDPYYKGWEPKVEAKLQELRSQGMNAPREEVLKWLLGDAVLAKRGGPTAKRDRQQAQRRVTAQRTRPANSGSDVASSRRDRGASLERRLDNVEL